MRAFASFVHPVLWAAWPLVTLYASNRGEVQLVDAWVWIAAVGGGAGAVTLVSRPFLRSHDAAGFLGAIAVALFYGSATLAATAHNKDQPTGEIESNSAFEPTVFGAALVLIVSLWCLRCGRLAWLDHLTRRLTGPLFVASLAAVCLNLQGLTTERSSAAPYVFDAEPRLRFGETGPDIYYIVLDSYGRADVLERYYGYDNRPFLNELERRGFFVADGSFSNYALTIQSIPSTLNMNYLDAFIPDRLSIPRGEYRALLELWMREAQVVRELRELGYRYEIVAGLWERTSRSPWATRIHPCKGVSDFGALVVEKTILVHWREEIVGRSRREQILCQYETLARVAQRKGPKFVFAHIVSPHPPWLFDREGGAVVDDSTLALQSASGDANRYIDQLIFNNTLVLKTVDAILTASEKPPIILLQGDHGPAEVNFGRRGALGRSIQYRKAKRDTPPLLRTGGEFVPFLWERLGNLNAMLLPGLPDESLYEEISPVNSFRLVFQHYFGADFELLADRAHYSFYGRRHLQWDVTETLREVEDPPPFQVTDEEYLVQLLGGGRVVPRSWESSP